MIVGIYNLRPKYNGGVIPEPVLCKKRFILNTDDYPIEVGDETGNFKERLNEQILTLLENRGYVRGTYLFETVELIQCYPFDCGYVLKSNRMQSFVGENLNHKPSQKQMDEIYNKILPVIETMSEIYPNIHAEPIFAFDLDKASGGMNVKLKELRFTIVENEQ